MKSLINTLGSYTSQYNDSKPSCTKSDKNSILSSVDTGYEKVEENNLDYINSFINMGFNVVFENITDR